MLGARPALTLAVHGPDNRAIQLADWGHRPWHVLKLGSHIFESIFVNSQRRVSLCRGCERRLHKGSDRRIDLRGPSFFLGTVPAKAAMSGDSTAPIWPSISKAHAASFD